MPTNLSIIGAGGQAKVVIDSLSNSKNNYRVCIYQEIKKSPRILLNKFPIQTLNNLNDLDENFHVAIGKNDVRERLSIEIIRHGKKPLSLTHQDAVVSKNATIKEGVFIAARAIIAVDTLIKEGCIINHAAVIDHDCNVGEYSHIAPNAVLGGGVFVGKQCLIGAGAIVLPNISIGNFSVIGAGSVVTKNVLNNAIIVGNPARSL